MDPLDDIFSTMHTRNAVHARIEASAPWGLHFLLGGASRFGLVVRGGCWLTQQGQTPVALAAGDCFLIPQGDEFQLRDHLSTPTLDCAQVVRDKLGGMVPIGGDGAATTVVTGWFMFDPVSAAPLLDLLPRQLLIRVDEERARVLQATLHLLALETAERDLGSGLVVSRLADVVFMQAVRAHVRTLGSEQAGWLAALGDRQLRCALNLVHKDVAHDWSVDALARAAGMSRSAFALRFRQKVGQSPAEYVTRWRMFRAAHLLRQGETPLVEVAGRVGYQSEAAFNKAFKRCVGTAPGAYRRQVRSASA